MAASFDATEYHDLFTPAADCPVGTLSIHATDQGITRIRFLDEVPGPITPHPLITRCQAQLAEYFAGTRLHFDLPLAPRGTEFQRAVWAALVTIPYGATEGYAALAERIGRPRAQRAVGAANGRNPLPIVVPCHRVIGSSGQLTGYAGGLARKRWLLDHEAAMLAHFERDTIATT